jgi:glycosyltransferase involved in cell wall biosynthesis
MAAGYVTRRTLRLAYVTGSLTAGGSERQMLYLACHLPRDRFVVEFVLLTRLGEFSPEARAAGIPMHLIPATNRGTQAPHVFAWRTISKAARVTRLLRRRRYDIVDAWLYPSYAQVGITRPLTRVPIVIAGRRSLSDFKAGFGWFDRTLDRLARDSADAIVANSQAVIDDVVAREGLARERLRLIRNGVEIPAPLAEPERAALRARFGVGPAELLVGTVANLKPAKGVGHIVEVAAAIAAAVPEARFRVIGEGYQRPELEARIAALGLGSRVVLAGQVPDARTLYGAFDLAVHASDAEGLPNAVLEAAAAGRAIVATAAGGTGEIVLDGQTGLLVPVGDRAALAAGIVRLARDPELRARLGAAARERAASQFGMERFVAETAALYEELAVRRGLWPA